VIDVETCPVLEPELDETLRRTREGIRSGLTAAITYVAAAGDDSANAFGGVGEPLPLYRTVGKYRYRFDASTFFQANGSLLDELVAEALWQVDSMPQEQRRTALDLYSGVGLFSLPLSEQFEQVVGVESDAGAVKHFKRNAKSNDRRNVLIHSVETKRFFRDQKKLARRANFALLDPPRIGLDKDTRDGLIEALPPVLTYVSCDATTLARDLKALLANGYELQRVRGLDCFPQTHHVEVVAHLRLP
jgi:23S rRNA (uracil1939-C5)-methyltransferase